MVSDITRETQLIGATEDIAKNIYNPAKKEPFLNQLAHVILVHNWYLSTSTCFHV